MAYETRMFIAAVTNVPHWILSWAIPSQLKVPLKENVALSAWSYNWIAEIPYVVPVHHWLDLS